MNRWWRHILIGWFAVCVGGLPAGHAAPAWFARVWQSDDGLPDNSVTGVTQTADGFLWVATQGGIVRFDGVQFERIFLPITPPSPTRMIRAMTVTGGDHLWLALEGGFVVSASPQGSVVYTVTNGLSLYRPVSMAQDNEGAVWVGYSDGTNCLNPEPNLRPNQREISTMLESIVFGEHRHLHPLKRARGGRRQN